MYTRTTTDYLAVHVYFIKNILLIVLCDCKMKKTPSLVRGRFLVKRFFSNKFLNQFKGGKLQLRQGSFW